MDDVVEWLKENEYPEFLTEREKAMVEYALKLTRTPSQVTEEDIANLRQAGLDESEILDTAQVTGYFAFVNRMASGLGVELEDYWGE